MSPSKINDASIERMVSVLLRTGVLLSGLVVFAGGVYYLARHGGDPANYQHFQSQPRVDRKVNEIVQGAISLRARSVIQFGILLLLATPVARVALCLAAFAFERDRTYVAITALVLAVLLISLTIGGVGG